jgi:hypothetical protein
MSVENGVEHTAPMLQKEPDLAPSKKRKFLGVTKEQNAVRVKSPEFRGCYNCRHQLSKFYYWKESPCESCHRAPTLYYDLLSMNHVDHWEPAEGNWASRRNALY